ncbi:hypothetical protein MVEN_01263400 [Mycena venus]|uniref:Uncharacterized protein n=1 Tax=Mycena venus TaxID=2733690 RepID=A0A8H7CWJ7_9AGAR|nr:hypothetical protein MVEN_01263400 [Mycena venus]
MVNWSNPGEIINDAQAFEKITFVFFGMQLCELFMTCGFEWSLLTRRRRFRWPLSKLFASPLASAHLCISQYFFFLSRYCMLFSFIGLIISFANRHPINCGALFTFNSWTGNMAILCASTSLMLRTMALWERKRSVVIPPRITFINALGLAISHHVRCPSGMGSRLWHVCGCIDQPIPPQYHILFHYGFRLRDSRDDGSSINSTAFRSNGSVEIAIHRRLVLFCCYLLHELHSSGAEPTQPQCPNERYRYPAAVS